MQFVEQDTQKPQPLVEIQCDESDGDDSSAGERQFGHHPWPPALALEVVELAFMVMPVRQPPWSRAPVSPRAE